MRSVWLQTHWDKFDNLLTDTFPEYFRFNQLITQWFQPHIHAPSVGHGLFFDQVPGLGNLSFAVSRQKMAPKRHLFQFHT